MGGGKKGPGQQSGMGGSKRGQGKQSGMGGSKRGPGKQSGMEGGKQSPGQQSGMRGGKQQSENMLERIDNVIDYVYSPKNMSRSAGAHGTKINIPIWLREVKDLFPNNAKELLERDLVKSSKIEEIIRHPELFDKIEPNMEMLGIILRMKNMLPSALREKAKEIVRKVVEKLRKKIRNKIIVSIVGALNKNKHTPIKNSKNIDWKQTISRNLKNYNKTLKKIILEEPRFFSRQRKKNNWQIIIMIDESGSMTESIIYSAVTASIFAEIPAIKTNLIIFDTQVVDLTDKIGHPIDVLMSTTLGGGTNIAKALSYAQTLMKKPKKTLYILISDFYEGGSYSKLTKELIRIRESEAKLIGIAALGSQAQPMYDRRYAQEMNKMGFDVLACTPEKLAQLVGKILEK